MIDYRIDGSNIHISANRYTATIATEGYTSGVAAGSFVDRKTKARDLGFGLSIVDFLLEPGDPTAPTKPGDAGADDPYHFGPGDPYHGNIAKAYVEGPQICTQAKKLPYEIVRGDGFLVVRQWYKYHRAYGSYKAGSRWEQILVFPEDRRCFFSADRVTSANDHPSLILRVDMPGHVRHKKGDTFDELYLSYHGRIPAAAFADDFPPDAKFHYRRDPARLPTRVARGYRVKQADGKPGPWLIGMTLSPGDVYEGWCHQRGYICLIEELGGRPVKAGGTFGACFCIGWFDHLEEMEAVYEMHRDWSGLAFDGPPDRPRAFRGLKQNDLPPVRAI
ncbi:MAG: hypothetical protein ACRC1K_26320 [Planctomycetia bacterium]